MRFKVVGNHTVSGVAPGRTVELDPDDPRTKALVKAGHLAARRSKPVGESGPELVTIPKGDAR